MNYITGFIHCSQLITDIKESHVILILEIFACGGVKGNAYSCCRLKL